MADKDLLGGQDVRQVLANIPVKIPSPNVFVECGWGEDLYWQFRDDLEIVTQQVAQKFLVQLIDAATEGVGVVPESVVKAAVDVDKALDKFVKVQQEQAARDDQRSRGNNGRKQNGNRSNKKKRPRRNRGRRAKSHGSKGR